MNWCMLNEVNQNKPDEDSANEVNWDIESKDWRDTCWKERSVVFKEEQAGGQALMTAYEERILWK